MHRLSGLALALAILFAQAALLEHEYDFAAHEAGHTCVTCLHATPLSHGISGALAFAVPLFEANTEFHLHTQQLVAIAASAYRARAPPVIPSA